MKETEDLDAESEQFLEDLRQFQRTIRPYVQDRLLPPTRRWFAGIRPAGFPPRRLAAVTVLLDRLFQKEDPLLPRFRETVRETQIESLSAAERRRFWKRLIADFVVDGNAHYFGTRYTLGGKKQRAQALLGEPAAMSLVFNAFLPLLLVEAREKKDRLLAEKAMTLLLAFPALEKNSIVRFMEKRLFGESKGPNGLLRLEIYQQALMKMFHDCCAANERTCDDCTFLALAEQLGQPAGAADS